MCPSSPCISGCGPQGKGAGRGFTRERGGKYLIVTRKREGCKGDLGAVGKVNSSTTRQAKTGAGKKCLVYS